MNTLEKLLNPEQYKAVTHPGGPMMIVAGAGSGKTRVLTYRIAWLMQQGVDPFHILALTFTNKAANEMKERIAMIVGESEARNIWMGTFHSVFAKILRREADKLGYPHQFTIYDQEDSEKAITAVLREMNLDKQIYKPKQVRARISMMKNNLITTKVYAQTPELIEQDHLRRQPEFLEIYRAYNDKLLRSGAMDFDDLLLKTNELLALYPEVLAKYQRYFRHILVDEYQDTNHSQYLIVRALGDLHRNISVVGDDAQSIYSFRGANIQNILNFQKDYPEATVYKLEQNYRSTKIIVGAGNSLIKHNRNRLEKHLWTSNDEGEKIKVYAAGNDTEEARFVAQDIAENKLRNRLSNKDFAILYRTNSQSRALEQALRTFNLPYRIYGGLSFYQRKEIKDVLAYLRLIVNVKDEEAFKRIVNFPSRKIGQTTVDKLQVAARKEHMSLFEVIENQGVLSQLEMNGGTRKRLVNFAFMIRSFQVMAEQKDVYELTKELFKRTKLQDAYMKEGTQEGINRVENIQELLNAMKDFIEEQRELENGDDSLTAFLQQVALYSDLDRKDSEENPDRITLMTIHMAKGLEFPHVYITGLEENLFPSAMSMTSREDLEEERRLLYVGITRAEKKLTLTYARTRYRWGTLYDTEPSRFIDEIDDKFLDRQDLVQKFSGGARSLLEPSRFENDLPMGKPGPSKPYRTDIPPSSSIRPKRLKKLSKANGGESFVSIDFAEGDRVSHGRFGKGTVLEISGEGSEMKAKVKFDNTGIKTLLLRYAKLSKLD